MCLEQSFRLVEGYTFGLLLRDALAHFGLPASPFVGATTTVQPSATRAVDEAALHSQQTLALPRFELRDVGGSVWPPLARIEDEIMEDDFPSSLTSHDQHQHDVWPVVSLVEAEQNMWHLSRRSLTKASKKKSHEPRSCGEDGATATADKKKKSSSKVRRAHSETPVSGSSTITTSTSSSPFPPLALPPSASVPSSSSSSSSSASSPRSSAPSTVIIKRLHSSELAHAESSSTSSSSSSSSTASGLQLDLEPVKSARARKDQVGGTSSTSISPSSSGEVSPTENGGSGSARTSPRKRDSPTTSTATATATLTSPHRRSPMSSSREADETTTTSSSSTEPLADGTEKPATKKAGVKQVYAEISRGVRTHLRAASDSLHSDRDDAATTKKSEAKQEKSEKNEKNEKNVIARLLSSERRDKAGHAGDDAKPTREQQLKRSTSGGSAAAKAPDEVEIQITSPPAPAAAGPLAACHLIAASTTTAPVAMTTTKAATTCMLKAAPTTPMNSPASASPLAMHKSGIRLVKVDSEHCINLPLVNSEIIAQRTSSKATKLLWEKPPSVVLIIKKPRDPVITLQLCAVAEWLEEKQMTVLVEPEVQKHEAPHLTSFTQFLEDVPLSSKVDFIITLGGDGTILHVNSLFPFSVPPVVSFAMGSLGFLTPFDIAEFEHDLACVIRGQFCLTVRHRLEAQIFKLNPAGEFVGSPTYQCMNEVVIDRGPDSHLCSLECYCDGLLITTIQADGVIISSTTGSTAYSLSAGGTMCHPTVPAVCFTPICPHSLSCRPIMFPDSVTLRIQVPEDARTRGWVSFDGRTRTELNSREFVVIKISRWPIPCINKTDHIGDWFRSLCECLNWNNRQKQKAFPPPS